jgi:hypothetical protein
MKNIFLTLTFVISVSFYARGDIIPYPSPGTIAPTISLTAATTGDIVGYFYGASAGDTDEVQVCDTTVGPADCSPLEFNNQLTPVGEMVDFLSVNAGDTLVITLDNLTTHTLLSSNPADSHDGVNHAYVTPYTGVGAPPIDSTIPPGTFIGMEDLEASQGSDFDYNDDQFVFTNVATSVTPEPSMLILCIGLVGLLPVARRRFGF